MCTYLRVMPIKPPLTFYASTYYLFASRELADDTTYTPKVKAKLIRHLINTSILIGGGVATTLSLTTYVQQTSILKGLTTNLDIRAAAAKIFPAVLLTQVLKGLAYPVNGIIMGGLDWSFTMLGKWCSRG